MMEIAGVGLQFCSLFTVGPQGGGVERYGIIEKKIIQYSEFCSQVLWSLVVRREASGVKSNHALDQLELDPDTGDTVSCR